MENKTALVICNADGKYALASADGAPLCAFVYDSITPMFNAHEYFVCSRSVAGQARYGILNERGKEAVPCTMDEVEDFTYNYAALAKDGEFGVLTDRGCFVEPVFDESDPYGEFLRVCKDGVWGFLDVRGNFVHEDGFVQADCGELLSYWLPNRYLRELLDCDRTGTCGCG